MIIFLIVWACVKTHQQPASNEQWHHQRRCKMVKLSFLWSLIHPIHTDTHMHKHTHVSLCGMKIYKKWVWSSSNCKSSTGQMQVYSAFMGAGEDEVQPDVLFHPRPRTWSVAYSSEIPQLVHSSFAFCLLSLLFLHTCGPLGSGPASDCSDWASEDGRRRWAVIARRRSRSLQSCVRRGREEEEVRVDDVKSLNTDGTHFVSGRRQFWETPRSAIHHWSEAHFILQHAKM